MYPIEQISGKQLSTHLKALDADSRRCRFGFTIKDDAIEKYTRGIGNKDILLGIRSSITDDTIASALHLAFYTKDNSAEIGISTLPHYRRRGLAERLLRYGVDLLRNRGIQQIYSVCLPENIALLKLLQKMGIIAIYSHEDEREARITIPMVGIDSILNEVQNQQFVVIDRTMRPWAKLWEKLWTGHK